MKQIFTLLFILILSFTSTIQAKVPKTVTKGIKALATVITYDKNDKMIGTSAAFFADNSNEAISEYAIFKYAVRAEIIDGSGKKSEIHRICGANEIYDVVKFTTKSESKKILTISDSNANKGEVVYIISSATSKKALKLESKIKEANAVNGGIYYTLDIEYKEQYVGTPVLNAKGDVIAIIQRNAKQDDKTTYAISAGFVKELSVKTLSYNDVTLSTIYMPKQIPSNEKDAITYLYMMSQVSKDSLLYVTALNDFIEQYPQNAEGNLERAKFFATKKMYSLSEDDIKKAIDKSEKKDNAHYVFGRLIYESFLYNMEKAKAANWTLERSTQEVLTADSINPTPLYKLQLADCYYGLKDYAKAIEYYGYVNKSEIATPKTLFSEAKSKVNIKAPVEEIIVLLDSAIAFYPKPYSKEAAPYLWARAEQYILAEKYREAVLDYLEYEHVVGFNNLNDNFYYQREQTAVKGKMYKQAIDDINRAVAMQPNDYIYNIEKASLMVRLGMFDEAIFSAKKAIQLKSNESEAYRILGIAYGENKQKKECLDALNKSKNLGDKYASELLNQYK